MAILNALRSIWELVAGDSVETLEDWAQDEEAFERHFGISYEDFDNILHGLDRAHFELYEKTLKVNPEAAVTWVVFVGTHDAD